VNAPASWDFLYRRSEGTIDARTWARAAWPPAAIAVAIVLAWLLIAPPPPQPLTDAQRAGPEAVHALYYYVAYSLSAAISVFALLFLGVAEYFVCAKRFADIGASPSWAALAPVSLLLAWAGHWYATATGDGSAWLAAYALGACAVLATAWTAFRLGFSPSQAGA
jgi:uncharacterized membrane protein YhaH (DUF805 family)